VCQLEQQQDVSYYLKFQSTSAVVANTHRKATQILIHSWHMHMNEYMIQLHCSWKWEPAYGHLAGLPAEVAGNSLWIPMKSTVGPFHMFKKLKLQ